MRGKQIILRFHSNRKMAQQPLVPCHREQFKDTFPFFPLPNKHRRRLGFGVTTIVRRRNVAMLSPGVGGLEVSDETRRLAEPGTARHSLDWDPERVRESGSAGGVRELDSSE